MYGQPADQMAVEERRQLRNREVGASGRAIVDHQVARQHGDADWARQRVA